MDGRLKQVSVGLVFVLSVSAVSGAVSYSQLRRGDDRPAKEEEKPKAVATEKPGQSFDFSGGAPVSDLRPGGDPAGEFSIGQALGFGRSGGHPGHGRGRGHDHHGNGHGHGHDHHDHDPPPVSPAHPGHHHGHGHHHHGNGHGHGHDHHDHD